MFLRSFHLRLTTFCSLNSLFAVFILLFGVTLVSCGPVLTSTPASRPQLVPTATSELDVDTLIATPVPEVEPAGPLPLLVWWPDDLSPVGLEKAALQLVEDVDDFHATNPEVRVEMRQKKARDVGGIMTTLKAASAVAPGALPDVTLLRRSDLLSAVASGYVQPLEGLVTSAVLGDLYPAALELGRVDGVVYGLPYTLDAELIAYRPSVLSGSFARFEDVLADQQPFVFPAGVTDGLSAVLFLQYLSAGGTVSDLRLGKPNQDALLTVLTFYQQAVAQSVIDPAVLEYARSDDYLFQVGEGKFNAAVVTSTQYLNLLADGQALAAAPIPLAQGEPTTVIDGWIWVMVTKDKDHQAQASRFIEWMVEAQRLATYTRLINMLPARRAAMRVWDGGDFSTLANRLLLNAHPPVTEDSASATLRALQNALTAVIGGQRTPEEAVSDVIEQAG